MGIAGGVVAGGIVGSNVGGAIGNAIGNTIEDLISIAQKGTQNQRDSGLTDILDGEISRRAHDNTLTPQERRRYQKEEKARGLRNKEKRKECH